MIKEKKIQFQLNKYIQDPENPELNFLLGYEYEKIKHYASAHTYYLRCAELTNDKDEEKEEEQDEDLLDYEDSIPGYEHLFKKN